MVLVDSTARSQATDPGNSYIVQAPAGSGKTEILTQRFLRLLSTVTAPEQIIALTFTRKAASEMRERILLALQRAADNQIASNPHQQTTLDYAKKALLQDQAYEWHLVQQPNRLKVITIDSLCQTINHAIPLVERQIAYSQITDRADSYYLKAARACIHFAMESQDYQNAIKTLLLHVDNRQDHLLVLFQNLLAQRDQWLTILFQARSQEQAEFEQAIQIIEQHELSVFQKDCPQPLFNELLALTRDLVFLTNDSTSKRYVLMNCFEPKDICQPIAALLCTIWLTGEMSVRKNFDHYVGLKKGVCSDKEYRRVKDTSKILLARLCEYPDFVANLIHISQIPAPNYDAEQWLTLQALFKLLPLLVGHLQLLFSQHNEVDFTTIAQQALSALGEEDNPSDLALYLDNAIHHLLVDEFQDTSITQFELLTKLVHGWQNGDGKTLFIVGDPMQSIYRFRQAEVGLFFRAKEQGIGPVSLNFLQLSCNFRSSETIVSWVNNHFSYIFPPHSDIESGAVSFHQSKNVLENTPTCEVHALQFADKKQEAEQLIQLINYELRVNPQQSMAILVRSRSHLAQIIKLLRQHQIPYQGTDIDLLTKLAHLRDVWTLTQALLFPGNRLAWLALLRSPYCGLTLNDILAIAEFDKKKSIYSALLELNQITNLSAEGVLRAQYFMQVMQEAIALRYQQRLADWVARTLKKLHVDKILTTQQLEDLNQLWVLFDSFEEDGRLPDNKEFMRQLSNLYSQQTTPSRLQIMTIHKSKGLEFDTVFLPSLGAQPKRADNPLLRWLKLPTQNHGDLLLVSPLQAAHQEHCALYDFLSKMEQKKAHFESQRLLYVAVTRAKFRLYLMSNSPKIAKGSFQNLLHKQEFQAVTPDEISIEEDVNQIQLNQLPLHFYQLQPQQTLSANNPSMALTSGLPRLTGIVAHKMIQWICDNHPSSFAEIPWNLAQLAYQDLGFTQAMQLEALNLLQNQIERLFNDERGAWIIAPHLNERNECELLIEVQNNLATRIIDRLFEYKETLWIIDFKTGKDDWVSLEKHQQQLYDYAYHLSDRTALPIVCGLYYLNTNQWVSWQYENKKLSALEFY